MWLLRVGALGYAFSLVRSAQGAWDVLPVESINLDAADRIQFFEGIPSENIQIFDAHAVHGIEATDGSFVLCGMGVEYESLTAPREAFCAKLDGATGAMTHSWRSNATGAPDAINAVLQLPGAGADLVAVGYRSVGGTLSRSMTILALADLTERWTYFDFGDAANLHGAWEFAALTGDSEYRHAPHSSHLGPIHPSDSKRTPEPAFCCS